VYGILPRRPASHAVIHSQGRHDNPKQTAKLATLHPSQPRSGPLGEWLSSSKSHVVSAATGRDMDGRPGADKLRMDPHRRKLADPATRIRPQVRGQTKPNGSGSAKQGPSLIVITHRYIGIQLSGGLSAWFRGPLLSKLLLCSMSAVAHSHLDVPNWQSSLRSDLAVNCDPQTCPKFCASRRLRSGRSTLELVKS
jgi:hypothetical protein